MISTSSHGSTVVGGVDLKYVSKTTKSSTRMCLDYHGTIIHNDGDMAKLNVQGKTLSFTFINFFLLRLLSIILIIFFMLSYECVFIQEN
jgi:hypothetical protein